VPPGSPVGSRARAARSWQAADVTGSISSRTLLLGAVAAVVVGLWLAFANPTVQGVSRGGDDGYTCLAPWDTVLNGADNVPGGEAPRDSEEIAQRCREAGQLRFLEAVATLAAGLGLGAGALVVRRREAERP
jgi:hypothetical protein